MAAGVVDQLELIQIQIEQRLVRGRILAHAFHRRREPILELAPVDEARERVVARLVMQGAMEPTFLAHVVEYHDRADQIAGPVADRGGRILDGDLLAAPGDERGMLREPEHLPLAQAPR